MSSIIIDEISANDDRLECSVRSSTDLERFFTDEPFRTSYDVPIEDVPAGVLAIPVLAQVCPVAWANGADVYVDEVDATFARALEDVQASLCEMYDFLEGGTLYARSTIEPEPEPGDESGLLFTGGVDSTCSYVRHREESPTLISIRGWTITRMRPTTRSGLPSASASRDSLLITTARPPSSSRTCSHFSTIPCCWPTTSATSTVAGTALSGTGWDSWASVRRWPTHAG